MKPTLRSILSLSLVCLFSLTGIGGLSAWQTKELRKELLSLGNAEPARGFLRRTYFFHDEFDDIQILSCYIEEKELEKEKDNFGYPTNEKKRAGEIGERFTRRRKHMARRLKIDPYVSFETSIKCDDGRGCKATVKTWYSRNPPLETRKALDAFEQWGMGLEGKKEFESEVAQYYYEKGFILEQEGENGETDKCRLDYRGLAARGRQGLENCSLQLQEKAGRGKFARQALYLGDLFQTMKRGYPPPTENGKEKYEFWVPAQVMEMQMGDCDSKAVAFASIWINNSSPVLIVTVEGEPRHALIGLEGLPRKGDAEFFLGNRQFVLYDIAGPDRLHPGVRLEHGSYVRHECIPPMGIENTSLCPPE